MKLKVPPVIVFLLSLSMMFLCYYVMKDWSYSFKYQKLISRLFLVSGVVVASSGIISFRLKGTTVDPRFPDKATYLVQNGVYRFTRNPMYLGMSLVLLGGFIRIGNAFSLIGIIFFFWYLTKYQIMPEEITLKKLFGKEYEDYCKKVRRWI